MRDEEGEKKAGGGGRGRRRHFEHETRETPLNAAGRITGKSGELRWLAVWEKTRNPANRSRNVHCFFQKGRKPVMLMCTDRAFRRRPATISGFSREQVICGTRELRGGGGKKAPPARTGSGEGLGQRRRLAAYCGEPSNCKRQDATSASSRPLKPRRNELD
jgi:hypothetical protein